MTDDRRFHEIETALRRQRIVGPPDRLRSRIRALDWRRSRTRWWIAAAAAAAAAFLFHVQASRALDDVSDPLIARLQAAEQAELADLVAALGGGKAAERAAMEILRAQ